MVAKNVARILKELTLEEERFVTTLERGEALLEQFLAVAEQAGGGLAGKDAFTLYDTYGFPVEITQEVCNTPQGIALHRYRKSSTPQAGPRDGLVLS
jgi:alanyl-tRNA synthetase